MMFLGADDYLSNDDTLSEVAAEITAHRPDVVWTGCAYAVLEDNEHKILKYTKPRYRIYTEKRDKLLAMAELMQDVYYNSVMHYVRIDFLKENGIDFFEPFYGDCQGMTEAIVRAKKMLVMDQIEYVLVVNTSQTATKVGFDYDIERQWASAKNAIAESGSASERALCFVAARILNNLTAMCQDILLGADIRNRWMNPIEKSLAERFERAEQWISSDAFGEMMYLVGREKYAEQLLGAAGVLYWESKRFPELHRELCQKSMWLAEFSQGALEQDAKGAIGWRTHVDAVCAEQLSRALENAQNRHRVGCELLLKEGVVYEKEKDRENIQKLLRRYQNSISL